jgi:hypothetical protein
VLENRVAPRPIAGIFVEDQPDHATQAARIETGRPDVDPRRHQAEEWGVQPVDLKRASDHAEDRDLARLSVSDPSPRGTADGTAIPATTATSVAQPEVSSHGGPWLCVFNRMSAPERPAFMA